MTPTTTTTVTPTTTINSVNGNDDNADDDADGDDVGGEGVGGDDEGDDVDVYFNDGCASLRGMDGVVFLNARHEKVILLRRGRRVVPLQRSGVSPSKRFTFFDQVGVITLGSVNHYSHCLAFAIQTLTVFSIVFPCFNRCTRREWISHSQWRRRRR
jgi:hypothetical protein